MGRKMGRKMGSNIQSTRLVGEYHIIYDYWYATEVFRLSLWEHSHLQNTCVTRSSHQQLFPPCRCSLIIWNNDNNGIIVALDALFVEYLYLTVWVIGSCTSIVRNYSRNPIPVDLFLVLCDRLTASWVSIFNLFDWTLLLACGPTHEERRHYLWI